MKEPIQKTSAEIETNQLKEGDEPFITALKNRQYEILFFGENKTHAFYCSDYYTKIDYKFIMYKPFPLKDEYPISKNLYPTGEWVFTDVIMDTSKRDPEGHPTLIRMTYHPQISLVNVPFMVLPATGENSVEHIPEDVNVLPSDEDLKHKPLSPCPYKDYITGCYRDNCIDCRERYKRG